MARTHEGPLWAAEQVVAECHMQSDFEEHLYSLSAARVLEVRRL